MFFKTKTDQRDRVIDYQKTFSTPEGTRVLHDLMNNFYVLNAHDGSPYKEGQRSVALSILAKTNVKIEELDKMLKGE